MGTVKKASALDKCVEHYGALARTIIPDQANLYAGGPIGMGLLRRTGKRSTNESACIIRYLLGDFEKSSPNLL
jgi:hypothetical protein